MGCLPWCDAAPALWLYEPAPHAPRFFAVGFPRVALITLGAGLGVVGFEVLHTARAIEAEFRDDLEPVVAPPGAPAFIDVSLTTPKGKKVAGWYVPSTNGAAVILGHGSEADRTQLWPELTALHAKGFGVLTFDFPGHGQSQGPMRRDDNELAAIRTLVDWLKQRAEVKHIGAYGFSAGAAYMLEASSDDRRIEAVMLAAAFTDDVDQERFEYRHANPIARWTAVVMEKRLLGPARRHTSDFAAGLRGRPVLLVQGTEDDAVPLSMANTLQQLTGGELWVIDGAHHGDYAQQLGEEWSKRLTAFFTEHLVPGNQN